MREAVAAGARFELACETIGIASRTVQRWVELPDAADGRAGPNTKPANALTEEEKAQIVAISTSPEYRNLSVRQIVPRLADNGKYVASESTFFRVLREADLAAHRNAARPASRRRPEELVAKGPREVWSWDITYLRASVRGTFYYLYLVLDVWSRKIVGFEVHDREWDKYGAALVGRAALAEGLSPGSVTLRSDNGHPMKGATMLATLQRLGIAASYSRPGVSDDNAICEALFRTLKYRPGYPKKPFQSLGEARSWVADFVAWYNDEHLHSSLNYVTPNDRHERRDLEVLSIRESVYRSARLRNPRRWSRGTRDWSPAGNVALTPRGKESAA